MALIGSAIDRTRTMMSLLAAIMFAGLMSYSVIPIETDPDVSIPVIIIIIPHEGISPEDAERLLARPMELELRTLEGVDEVNSYAGEGQATIVIEGRDYIEITPPSRLKAATIDTYGDHRMAMCFSLAALGAAPITINDPDCVSKTFPDYFAVFDSLIN